MTLKDNDFDISQWADDAYVKKYVESVDIIIPDRRVFLDILSTFFATNFSKGVRVLDLGSGDGFFIERLLNIDDSIDAVLVDASPEMLRKAGDRLSAFENISFVESTFEGLLDDALPQELEGGFDLIISSLAIHHIALDRRGELFASIHSLLKDGGRFINFDISMSISDGLEDFYIKLWEERVIRLSKASGIEVDYKSFMAKHSDRDHHDKLSTLDGQLSTLRDASFKEVDVYYKHGLFAVYGGLRKGGSCGG
ncbi:MAG: class I SAM-dependent methyltransferase [Deltaproteobacteria bacterium]|nr:class I SAM-dependent methyltransferase [Deltaproteobacteria bacterium]